MNSFAATYRLQHVGAGREARVGLGRRERHHRQEALGRAGGDLERRGARLHRAHHGDALGPEGPQVRDGGADIVRHRRGVGRARGAAAVAPGARAAEVERQDAVVLTCQAIGEIEPGALVRGEHRREHHAGGVAVRAEEPAGQLHAARGRERDRLRVLERLILGLLLGVAAGGQAQHARTTATSDTHRCDRRMGVGMDCPRATCPASCAGDACA